MDKNTALVVREFEVDYKSPFHRLVSLLEQKYHSIATTEHGAIVWSAFPFEEALADGVFLVMTGVAKQIDLSLTTTSRVDAVADLVDKMLNVGLLLVYGNQIEMAVNDFHLEVVESIEKAILLGYVPGMKLSVNAWKSLLAGNDFMTKKEIRLAKETDDVVAAYNLWQMVTAMYLSKLVKRVREFVQVFRDIEFDLQEYEFLSGDKIPVVRNIDIVPMASLVNAIDLNSVNVDDRWIGLKDKALGYKLFSERWVEIQNLRVLSRLLRTLNLNIEACDLTEMEKSSTTVVEHWINTQILLAAIDAHLSLDVCSFDQFESGRLAVRENLVLVQEKATNRIVKRLNKDLDNEELVVLTDHIGYQAQFIRGWKSLGEMQILPEIFFAGNLVDEVMVSEGMAKEIFLGDLGGENLEAFDENSSERLEVVANSIDWPLVKLSEWRRMVQNLFDLPCVLAVKTPLLSASIRKEAIHYLLIKSNVTEEMIEILIDNGSVEVDWDFILEYTDHVPQRCLADYILTNSLEVLDKLDSNNLDFIVRGVLGIEREKMICTLEMVDWRLKWIEALAEIVNVLPRTVSGTKLFDRLKQVVGRDKWNQWLLAYCISHRFNDFKDWFGARVDLDADEDDFIVPWESYWDCLPFHYTVETVFGLNQTEMKELFSKDSEDKIMKWVFEGKKYRQRKYREWRKKYFVNTD